MVRLTVYNLHGQEIRTLIAVEMNAGQYMTVWDGKDNHGQLAPSGVYLYKLSVNGFVETKKMSLVK